ncbi:MAG: DNA mismatch repair endonuclease MutL [Lachnospiraceae bacterium]|nr:DNA mismatch repair endonuclease MutL [Lachnospiraceae bacterium]
MDKIALLSQDTIDKIAAGEVVERPASVVKELVENAVDAGANAVTVEIKDGGISLIRITDNGCGIPKEQVQAAFLRHATSKIRTVDDLLTSGTLGFRGEALSSIAAVCQVEMITKTPGSLLGVRYVIEGGIEKSLEEIGAPEGTTFLVRNLFYHTPARRKFLKSATTEAGYVGDLMERLALSHPNIAFKFINNRDTKLHTSGNGRIKDIIYGVYGREITSNVVEIESENGPMRISGYIGKPVISRGNRNYENYFVNGRYVRSAIIARAIEDAYKPFMMSHRYPLTVLTLDIDTDQVDVNVHPTKMEVRFADQSFVYDQVYNVVKEGLLHRELIPEFTIENKPIAQSKTGVGTSGEKKVSDKTDERAVTAGERNSADAASAKADSDSHSNMGGKSESTDAVATENKVGKSEKSEKSEKSSPFRYPEPFEKVRSQLLAESKSPYEPKYPNHSTASAASANRGAISEWQTQPAAAAEQGGDSTRLYNSSVQPQKKTGVLKPVTGMLNDTGVQNQESQIQSHDNDDKHNESSASNSEQKNEQNLEQKPVQMELFDDKLLSEQNIKQHKLIGQVFDTYWIVEFQDKMYIIDQHAAHEKVLYERFMKDLAEKKQTSQMVTPPIIVSLSMQEEEMLKKHMDRFTEVGFEVEPFGGREYSICAVPGNLYSIADRTLFLEMLDGLTDVSERASDQAIREKIASMSCKAAVKGNRRLSVQEVDALIGELLTLENPYNCPHGRPTIIAMTKYELEKKFKRVV